jgi:ferritin-like metal-binding protein YciE
LITFSRNSAATPDDESRAAFQSRATKETPSMATKEKTLDDAFYETLKDVFYAEKQSVKALKKSAKSAKMPELKQAFEKHAEESAHHVERLQAVFESIGKPARGKTCEAMQGLTAEMEEDLEDFGGTEAADDVLIGCAQAMEHYEIARYGMLRSWAAKLGQPEAEKLLQETLEEEKRTDELLTRIAEDTAAAGKASAKTRSQAA